MTLRAIQRRQVAELLAGVVPAAIVFTPFLLLLLQALVLETIPGLVRGRPLSEDWAGIGALLLGPIGLLALVSLTVLILRGPQHVAAHRRLAILVIGSGIPALVFSIYFLWLQVVDPRARATGGELVLLLPLVASTLVGGRYLRFLPLLVPRPVRSARSTGRSSRTRPSAARPTSRSGRSRARPSQRRPA